MKSNVSEDATGSAPSAAPLTSNIAAMPTLSELEIAHGRVSELEDLLKLSKQDHAAVCMVRDRMQIDIDAARKQLGQVDDNPFMYALRSIDAGSVLEEAGEKVAKLFKEAKELEGKGTFTLTIAVKPYDNSDAMQYAAKCKVTLPTNDKAAEFMWVDVMTGKISRNNPRQRLLDFGEGVKVTPGQ